MLHIFFVRYSWTHTATALPYTGKSAHPPAPTVIVPLRDPVSSLKTAPGRAVSMLTFNVPVQWLYRFIQALAIRKEPTRGDV